MEANMSDIPGDQTSSALKLQKEASSAMLLKNSK
jgi:hypothetical protein